MKIVMPFSGVNHFLSISGVEWEVKMTTIAPYFCNQFEPAVRCLKGVNG